MYVLHLWYLKDSIPGAQYVCSISTFHISLLKDFENLELEYHREKSCTGPKNVRQAVVRRILLVVTFVPLNCALFGLLDF